jgi:hypothetical protein
MDILGYLLGGSLVLWVIWRWVIVPYVMTPDAEPSSVVISAEGRAELASLRVAVLGCHQIVCGDTMHDVPDWITLHCLCQEYNVPFETSDIGALANALQEAIISCHKLAPPVDAGTPVTT